ncbi:MAG: XdhC/CoxI family protein [Paracoccaceae bacterium]
MEQDLSPEQALNWHRAGRGAVLVTVIETWGSAPRVTGSQMTVAGDMAFAGSVSGGCVEAAVVQEAQEVLRRQRPLVLSYGVSDDDAFAAGLACGGKIRLLLEPIGPGGMEEALLDRLVAARAARQPIAYHVDLESWQRHLAGPDTATAERFRLDRSGLEGTAFIAIHNPPTRLFLIGAVQIAQHLAPMARAVGHDVWVIDPRPAFASIDRFPGQNVICDWPDKVIGELVPDARTAVVTLSHDAKIDDAALLSAFPTPAYYLGCLGSRRTHADRLARLAAAAVGPGDLARLHGPVGLDIGARTPAEIALSILAEMTESLRCGAQKGGGA